MGITAVYVCPIPAFAGVAAAGFFPSVTVTAARATDAAITALWNQAGFKAKTAAALTAAGLVCIGAGSFITTPLGTIFAAKIVKVRSTVSD